MSIFSKSGLYPLRPTSTPHIILGAFSLTPYARSFLIHFETPFDLIAFRKKNRHFSDEEKRNNWAHIVAPSTTTEVSLERDSVKGPAPIHASLDAYSSLISPSIKTTLDSSDFVAKRDKVYLHVIQNSGYNPDVSKGAEIKVSVDDSTIVLREGDGVYVMGTLGKNVVVENVGNSVGEVILFDVE
jgi:quercetin 2,3-dioxygenase